eukprot:g21886.t1
MVALDRSTQDRCEKCGASICERKIFVLAFLVVLYGLLGLGVPFLQEVDTEFDSSWIDRDSRYVSEMDFLTAHWPEPGRQSLMTVENKQDLGGMALTKDILSELLKAGQGMLDISVNLSTGRVLKYEDLCARPTSPIALWGFEQTGDFDGLPCYLVSPLMCFQEGKYFFNLAQLEPPTSTYLGLARINAKYYDTLPSFMNITDQQILAHLNTYGCLTWAGTVFPAPIIEGGIERDAQGVNIRQIPSLRMALLLEDPTILAQKTCAATCQSHASCWNSSHACIKGEGASMEADQCLLTGTCTPAEIAQTKGSCNANMNAMLGQTTAAGNLYGMQCGAKQLATAESGCYAAYTKPCAQKSLADVASPCGKFSFQCSKSELADEAGSCSPIATTCAATTLASLLACAK